MKFKQLVYLPFSLFFFLSLTLVAQNIAVNTSGNPAAAANLLEVTQPATAPTDYVGIFARNLSTGTNAYAIWAEATGAATGKYAIVVPSGGGNVGIGTITPSTPLTVGNSLITNSYFSTWVASAENVNGTATSTTASEAASVIINTPLPTANSTAYNVAQITNARVPSGALNYGTLQASYNVASFNGTGTLTTAYGNMGRAFNESTGTITTAVGAWNTANNLTTGTIGTGYGTLSRFNNGSGTTTTAYGLYADVINAGTLTTGYGMYIGGVAATTKYSLYASDAAAPNYFAGKVGIGATTPSQLLHVQGAAPSILVEGSAAQDKATIRFTGEAVNDWRGGYMQYDGVPNKLIIGVHDAGDVLTTSDVQGIVIDRITANVGVSTSVANGKLDVYGDIYGLNEYSFSGYNEAINNWDYSGLTTNPTGSTAADDSWYLVGSPCWGGGVMSRRRFRRVPGLTLEWEAYCTNNGVAYSMAGFVDGASTNYSYAQNPANLLYMAAQANVVQVYENAAYVNQVALTYMNTWTKFRVTMSGAGANYYVYMNNQWTLITSTATNSNKYVRVLVAMYCGTQTTIRNMRVYQQNFDGSTSSGGSLTNACATANYIPKMNSANSLTCSQIFDNGTNVGIGTAAPAYKFTLQGLHATTQIRLFSDELAQGITGANTANMSIWASEPGATWTGVGIGNNVYNTTAFPRVTTTRGGSYMRLLDNQINFDVVSATGVDINGLKVSVGSYGFGGIAIGQYHTLSSHSNTWLYMGDENGAIYGGRGLALANAYVASAFYYPNGSQGAGKVLTSDASGLASWQAAAGGITMSCATNNYLTKRASATDISCSIIYDDGTNVGVGVVPSGSYKLEINGKIKTTDINETSDIRWKKDISTLDSALFKVKELRGVNYKWRADEFKNQNFELAPQIGLIAQEVEKIFPQLVETDKEGFKSVEYTKLVAVLIEAIKEQQKIIDSQRAENKTQQSAIGDLQTANKDISDKYDFLINILFEKGILDKPALDKISAAKIR